MREQGLQAALAGLEPRPMGRPRKEQEEGEEVGALRAEVKRLRRELQDARVREELAVAMPALRARGVGKKTMARQRPRAGKKA